MADTRIKNLLNLIFRFRFKSYKILFLLAVPLLFNACGGGGGGGGGGGASGAATNYTVTSCTDSGTRDTEYLFLGKYNGQNGLTRVCASAAYARSATGNGIKIAVLDTGITVNGSNAVFHTELDANVISFTSGSDLIGSDSVPNDEHGHGSHVAGIIAGENNGSGYHGVAYDADLYIYKVLNDSGSSVGNSIASGITKARGDGVDIMNLSLGGSDEIGTNCNSVSTCETYLGSTLYTELEASGAAGKILVWAAGNRNNSSPSVISGAAIYDTDFKETTVIVVATGEDGKIGTTSNGWASSGSNKCGIAAAICIAAPGTNLYSAMLDSNNFALANTGTSMAAPMVSGGLALIKQEFSSLTNAQVVDRLFATATDTNEYSQSSIYGHGMMNLNGATAAVGSLQLIGGGNLLDDVNSNYSDLANTTFISSAAFSNALISALQGQTMEVYDSFDRANFNTNISNFFSSGSYTSQNTTSNHMARLKPKTREKIQHKNLYGNFTTEVDSNFLKSSMFKSTGDFIALGYNHSTNSFENAVEPLSDFFNNSNFGNSYLVNPYFYTGSGQDYFISFNSNNSFGIDTFTNKNNNDIGLAINLNPLTPTGDDEKKAGDLQIVLDTNYEQNKFLNSASTGVFATGDMSNTNFTGIKYKKNLNNDFTFVGFGFAGYTHIDKALNSYIDKSTPILTSTFTLGLVKANFIKKNQKIGFFINQPQRVEDGSINLRVPTSSDRDRMVTYSNLNVDLEPNARQINYDIVFHKMVTETSNLSVNLTHVQNGDHSSKSQNQNFFSLFYKKSF